MKTLRILPAIEGKGIGELVDSAPSAEPISIEPMKSGGGLYVPMLWTTFDTDKEGRRTGPISLKIKESNASWFSLN